MTHQDLLAVAQEFGNPVYVYDASIMETQYKRLAKAFKGVKQVKFNYAVKALSNISVLKLLNSFGCGHDTPPSEGTACLETYRVRLPPEMGFNESVDLYLHVDVAQNPNAPASGQ